MSMSTPGDMRRPSTAKPGATPADGGGKDGPKPTEGDGPKQAGAASSGTSKTSPAKTSPAKAGGAKAGGARPAAKAGAAKTGSPAKATPGKALFGGGAGAPPKTPPVKGNTGRFAPVRVAAERNWGPIMMFSAAGLVALLIIGFAAYQVWKAGDKTDWQKHAAGISGIVNYRETAKDDLNQQHAWGPLTFKQTPPVGGTHNYNWQNCMGDVYTSEIPKEQAVHSLEHGAVWVTYKPDLPQAQIDQLAAKVKDRSFMLMSPYPGLDKNISLQAWGYQLKVDKADDGRIDEFIQALRQNASLEPQAGCSGGITDTGTVPLDLGKPAASESTAPTPTPSAGG